MPKAKSSNNERLRHDPLHVELSEGNGILRTKARGKTSSGKASSGHGKDSSENGPEEDAFIDSKTSRKILQMAQEQQREIEQEDRSSNNFSKEFPSDEDEDYDQGQWEDDDEEGSEGEEEYYEEYIDNLDVDPTEEMLFRRYMGHHDEDKDGEGKPVVTLADKIMEKIREKEEREMRQKNPELFQDEEPQGVLLPPKVIEVYTRVGELLSRYRSGKLPKAFKIIPSLKNWQDVLYVTQPEAWSNQAVYEATKLFVSNLKAGQAQIFINRVVLEAFREQLQTEKTLNYHLYRALKKSLYKPSAFFKGFLFPLCESGTCTLREAVIAGSVLTKVSVPSLHSAAALLRLADMQYSGPNSLFIKILLDKKYALPFKVIDGVVFHFIRFRQHKDKLPVIWHQSFLVFAQRYKNDITDDQKDALLEVLRSQVHPGITPEIRRELLSGRPRDADVDMA